MKNWILHGGSCLSRQARCISLEVNYTTGFLVAKSADVLKFFFRIAVHVLRKIVPRFGPPDGSRLGIAPFVVNSREDVIQHPMMYGQVSALHHAHVTQGNMKTILGELLELSAGIAG